MRAFIERITGSQVGGATETLQPYERHAILVGIDGAVEHTQEIIGGDLDPTVAQNPYAMGKVGVKQATKAANGKTIDPRIHIKIREEQFGSLLGVEE